MLATLVIFCMHLDLDLSLLRFTDMLLHDKPQRGTGLLDIDNTGCCLDTMQTLSS